MTENSKPLLLTLCHGESSKGFICPKKGTCARVKPITNHQWQTYFVDLPIFNNNNCEFYSEQEHG